MFDAYETSARGGKPGHLFLFTRQLKTWRFASGDRDITIGSNTYVHAPIARSEIKQTIEKAQDQITITFPYMRDPAALETPVTQDFGNNWFPFIPSDPINVVCMAYHAGDADAQAVIEWQGIVAQPKFTDGQLELTCLPNAGADQGRGNGPKWQRACWKTVYSTGLRGCLLVPSDFETAATLTAVNGLVVSAAEFSGLSLSLAGGKIYWTRADGVVEQRSIMAHSDADITLLYGAADLAAGLAVTGRPGCERTWAACDARGNTINYGGSIYKPVQDPYTGQSMSWG